MIELLLVVLVLLILFGPGRLPRAGETLGKAVRSFKDAVGSRGQAGPGAGPARGGAAGAPPGKDAKEG